MRCIIEFDGEQDDLDMLQNLMSKCKLNVLTVLTHKDPPADSIVDNWASSAAEVNRWLDGRQKATAEVMVFLPHRGQCRFRAYITGVSKVEYAASNRGLDQQIADRVRDRNEQHGFSRVTTCFEMVDQEERNTDLARDIAIEFQRYVRENSDKFVHGQQKVLVHEADVGDSDWAKATFYIFTL